MDSIHKNRSEKCSKNDKEIFKQLSKDCREDKSYEKPVLRLRSMTALTKQSSANKPRGHILKKALRNKLTEGAVKTEQPVVDVFESLINRKMTYTLKDTGHKNCKSNSELGYCEDCNLEVNRTPTRFGKVYPSPNEKFHTASGKNNNPLKYTTTPMENNISCSDIDISLPVKNDKINIQCDLFQADDNFEPTNHVPSIFGKVYVKKPSNDLNFLKKSSTQRDTVIKRNIEKCTSGKRKRCD